jgi:uncharacterized FlaG/YvyC family protein
VPVSVYVPPEPASGSAPPIPLQEAKGPESLRAVPDPKPEEVDPSEPKGEDRKEGLEKMVERLNRVAKELGHRLSFDLYEGTEEFYAKVIDRRTNDIVKMVPAKEVLELHRRLQEVIGVIVDREA